MIVLLCGLRLGTATLRTEASGLLSMMIQYHRRLNLSLRIQYNHRHHSPDYLVPI